MFTKNSRRKANKEIPSTYVPKVSVNVSAKESNRNSSRSYEDESESKMPMNSRWAKPVTEITRPVNKNSTSTPRPVQFNYKNSLTRNDNKEVCLMEKYCSNSVSEILNWGFTGDANQ